MQLNNIVQWRGNYYHLRAINNYNLKSGTCDIQLLGPIIRVIPNLEDCSFTFTSMNAPTTTIAPTTTLTPTTTLVPTTTLAPITTTLVPTTTATPVSSSTCFQLQNYGTGSENYAYTNKYGQLITGSLPPSGSVGNVISVCASSNPYFPNYPGGVGQPVTLFRTDIFYDCTYNSCPTPYFYNVRFVYCDSGVNYPCYNASTSTTVISWVGPLTIGDYYHNPNIPRTFIIESQVTPPDRFWNGDYIVDVNNVQYDSCLEFCPTSCPYTVGQIAEGGVIAYVLQPGDPGYSSTQQKGLVATIYDLPFLNSGSYGSWGCQGTLISGADGTAIGTGNQNTIDIMAGCATTDIAARLCGDLTTGSYSDWYLPSIDELSKLYDSRVVIGNFQAASYWSSTENNANTAWYANFAFGGTSPSGNKSTTSFRVRPVRSFTCPTTPTTLVPTTTTIAPVEVFSGCGYGNSVAAACDDATINSRTLYSNCNAGVFGVGCIVYTNAGGTTLLSGHTNVFMNGASWDINSSTGVITAYSSVQC